MGRRRSKHKSLLRTVRQINRPPTWLIMIVLVALTSVITGGSHMDANYAQLLSTIAEGESRGNYNAYFGHAASTKPKFTDMSVGKVLSWQQSHLQQGSASSAVGKYQFINSTLAGLVDELNIDSTAKFDEQLQDRLAIQLIKRRGAHQYLRGQLSREQFAHNLSREWAALPRVIGDQPESSYYAGDGLNRSHITVAKILAAIDSLNHPADKS